MKPVTSRQLKLGSAKSRSGPLYQDPVEVYCRIRPLPSTASGSCVQVISPSTVQLSTPDGNIVKEVQYTFSKVFNEESLQKEVFDTVALSLVSQLVSGKNGLLFTYGVTGSGKTHTMIGHSTESGIMPRCIDVLFNSITAFQAKKYIFKPDKLNGFEIQDEADAMLAVQRDIPFFNQAAKSARKRRDGQGDNGDNMIERSGEDTVVNTVDDDNVFAVFITFIEIYNNSVHDLLDMTYEDNITRKLQNKVIREDGSRNMYVHGVTEVEVKSAEEALEVFSKGQKKRKVANTFLNNSSSRSHSVFTIRLVQAPLDSAGECIMQDKKFMTISQLSLVDLAGSERTNRTKNTGQRLREAGNINNSLMTLRTCLEILRENQQNNGNKIVPYRDSKLTHLFKNYFDGEGQVRMIVCVNPSSQDYDENVCVMKFAEMTQEVQVAQATPMKFDVGFTPGRRRANILYKKKLEEHPMTAIKELALDPPILLSFDLKFPNLLLQTSSCEETVKNVIFHLEQRNRNRNTKMEELVAYEEEYKRKLFEREAHYTIQTQSVDQMKLSMEFDRKKISSLENQNSYLMNEQLNLQRKLDERDVTINTLKTQLLDKDLVISQKTAAKNKVREKYETKIAATKVKLTKEMNEKLNQKRDELATEAKFDRQKLMLLKEVLDSDTPVCVPSSRLERNNTVIGTPSLNTQGTYYQAPTAITEVKSKRGPAVANLRHRRSRSVGEKWLDHNPQTPVPLNTVFQPRLRKRKSVTKLVDVKDVANSKTSKYCLTTQEQDTDGELETRLYKGDVIPTSCGGAQVVISDVELLKQLSPTAPLSSRKRSLNKNPPELEEKCAISIEGHTKRSDTKRSKF